MSYVTFVIPYKCHFTPLNSSLKCYQIDTRKNKTNGIKLYSQGQFNSIINGDK